MTMHLYRALLAFALLSSSAALEQTAQHTPTSTTQPRKHPTANQAAQNQKDPGARVFRQNCSRCHNTPDGFSPSISGTVLRHMSVRASLSMRDKADLMRFLNP